MANRVEKEDYIPKFKLGQRVKYIGSVDLSRFSRSKDGSFSIDEIINYNTVKGYYPQSCPIKDSWRGDDGTCQYIIGGRWHVFEKELEEIKKK